MIPSNEKDILLLPVTDGWLSNPFNMPGFPGYNKNKAQHNGVDLGWVTTEYCDVLACQDGTVVQIRNNDSSVGNAVTLEHCYSDGSHRWTSYIHLKDNPTVRVGDFIRQGQKVGVRGGSPYINGKAKYGVHLHLYVTLVNKKAYKWKTLLDNVIDPFPLLYRSKAIKYNWLNADLRVLPFIEDVEKVDDLDAIKKENANLQKQVADLQTKAEKLQLVNNGLMNRMSAIRDLTNEE